MKCSITKEAIIEGLQKAGSIVPSKTGAAYLRTLWLKAEQNSLYVMSTNAEIQFTGCYPTQIQQEGLLGVRGRAFVDLISKLSPGEVSLTLDPSSENLLIEQQRRKYKLPVSNAEWFQKFLEFPDDNAVVWSGDFFQELIEKIEFCISDDPGEAISCLYMKPVGNGRIDVCGLNTHQFAILSFINDDLAQRLSNDGILINKKYIQNIKKWLGSDEIEMSITEKFLFLRTLDGKEMLCVPRSTYTYPDYSVFLARLSGENVKNMTINRKDVIEALGRNLIFNTEVDRGTYMNFKNNEVCLSAQGQDIGSATENIEISYDGEISEIIFPTRNLFDILGHFISQNVEFVMTSADGPCGIRGHDDPEYTIIIMPIVINEETYYSEDND